jgi:hypothetical protein
VGGTCGGSLAGNTYTTNAITANCTVIANFAISTYTVTPSAGSGGTINPSTPQTINSGATTSFTVTPSGGYHIASVGGTCGGSLVGNVYTTNSVTADCTVIANFSINTFTVSPSATGNGTINPSTPQTVNYNQTTSFTLTPSAGYNISSVTGTCGGTLAGSTFTTNAITANCTVIANFAINTFTVTPSVTGSGTINPSTPQTVNSGATTSFTLTPSGGYHVASVTGTCGGTLVGNTYTTNAVMADCTVMANFAADTSINIPTGTHNNYTTNLGDGVSVTFSQITGPCDVSKTAIGTPGIDPSGYRLGGTIYDISHTGCTVSGPIIVTMPYNESSVSGAESSLRLFHWDGSAWNDITTSVNTANNTISGTTMSLSPFGSGYPYSGYPAGANIYVVVFLAFIAISAGVGLIKKDERRQKMLGRG